MKTVLLVDGDTETLKNLWSVLNRQGYSVVHKADGRIALSAVESGMPVDIVIIGCEISGLDGFELVRLLKQTATSIPVIMLSGCASVESYLKALSMGVFEYIIKPIKAEEIVRIVKAALGDQGGGRTGRAVAASRHPDDRPRLAQGASTFETDL